MKHKELDNKRSNAEFATERDYEDFEQFGNIVFVMLDLIIGLNYQTIQKKWSCIFIEKNHTYQNGTLLSKNMKTKDQNVESLILKWNAF